MSGTRSPRPSADRESPAGGGGRLPPVVKEETTDCEGATESRRKPRHPAPSRRMQGGGRKGRNRQDRRVGRPSPLLTHVECGERGSNRLHSPQEAGQEMAPPTRRQNRTNPPPATELIDQRQQDGRVRLQSQKNWRKREPSRWGGPR